MIGIDGSFGEGGGQILRTSLSLSLVTGKPFRIEKIRARRQKPGLLRQHLTAVQAAAQVGAAQVEGAELGSTVLTFVPGKVQPGEYRFAVGTAGSATLVFQTLLPALMTAEAPSRLTLEGGTHNSAAPPFDFLERAFVPLVECMGPRIRLCLERYGFYPAGGGRFTAEIDPCVRLAPLHLEERGTTVTRRIIAVAAHLPGHIARREVEKARELLNWAEETQEIVQVRESSGPGNIVIIELGSAGLTEVFSSFGRLGTAAEKVASEAVDQVRAYMASRAAVGEYLADQLLLPLALAGGGSFTAENLSMHARTNIEAIGTFLPVKFETERGEGLWKVRVLTA